MNYLASSRTIRQLLIASLSLMVVVGCASLKKPFDQTQDAAPTGEIDWQNVKPITPKYEPLSRYGNPESYEQNGRTYVLLASADNHKEQGVASWYGTKFHGRRTSSGETYDMLQLTAAHKTLPIPAYAKVTNLENGKQVIVKINDRGPFAKDRIIDLSYAAAHQIGMTEKGTAQVEVETITFDAPVKTASAEPENQPTNQQQQQRDPSLDRYVQVGAFSVHETAQKLAKVLDREIQLPVKITHVRVNGKKLYRVRIGPVPSEDLAMRLVDTLNLKELGKPQIIYQ